MSFSDRDWYQTEMRRHERWQHPLATLQPVDGVKSEHHLLIVAWVVVISAAVGVSFAANRLKGPPISKLTAQPSAQISLPSATAPSRQDTPLADAFQAPETHQVVKCVANGRITYSAVTDCVGGNAAPLKVDPSRSEIEGGFSAYELQMLQSADARIARDQAAVAVAMSNRPSTQASSSGECDVLSQEIHALDVRSRSLMTGYQQEQIRATRLRASQRQFDLHC